MRPLLRASTLAAALACVVGLAGAPTGASATGATNRFLDVQLLSINDFHGNLEPPGGSSGVTLNDAGVEVPAGGAEYLATHLRQLRHNRTQTYTTTVAAGDLVGASPLLSAIVHDEATIEFLNMIGLKVSATGNHEYDEGITELLRLQNGGCSPDGCYGGDGFAGADFTYLSANVTRSATGRLVMPAYAIRTFGSGVKLGFIGMPLEATPTIVTASGVAGLQFGDEVEATHRAVRQLKKKGVEAIVLLLHQGDQLEAPSRPNDCNVIDGPAMQIARSVDAEVDAVFTGHSHQAYNCVVDDPHGRPRPVMQGSSFGRLISEIDLTIDKTTKDVVRNRTIAVNHVVTRDVAPDRATTALLDKYRAIAAPIANRQVGTTTGVLDTATSPAGESAIGDVIADAQLAATAAPGQGGAQIAFMNPGGIRAGIDAGPVTYGEAFTVQPFNNTLVTMTLTGAQIETLLSQQFNNSEPGSSRILQVSDGFSYTYRWSGSGPATISDVTLNGTPIGDGNAYRVTVNSFLADGGDNFLVLRDGTDRLVGGLDIDAFTAYLSAHSPLTPPVPDRITKIG